MNTKIFTAAALSSLMMIAAAPARKLTDAEWKK